MVTDSVDVDRRKSYPDSSCCSGRCVRKQLKRNLNTLLTLCGAICGILFGVLLLKLKVGNNTIELIAIPGQLFMRALYMLMAPLIVSSITSGIAESKEKGLGKIAKILPFYCIGTTTIAGLTGVGLHFASVPLFQRNANVSEIVLEGDRSSVRDIFLDLLRNLIPNNIVRAFFQVSKTTYDDDTTDNIASNATSSYGVTKSIVYVDNANMCGLILFSIMLGIALRKSKTKTQQLTKIISQLNYVIMELLNYIMWTCPIGIFFLIAESIGSAKGGILALQGVLTVGITHTIGLLFHVFITINSIYFIFTRKNPFVFMLGVKDALITAWSTMSSAATLPTSIRCMERQNRAPKTLTRLILPIMATVNMDGGAIMITQAVLFTAYVNNIPIGAEKVFIIFIIGALSSIGAAAMPGTLAMMYLITCSAAGIPDNILPYFMAAEFIVDRCRTATNVYGDCVGVAVMNSIQRKRPEIVDV